MEKEFSVPMSRPEIGQEEIDAVLATLKSGWPSQGKVTVEFESLLSEYLSSNVVVVNNGSSALMCALLADGIKPGDKIIVPSFTFIATSSIPKILGAEIIAADIDPMTMNISPDSVEAIVKKTDVKSVIIVGVGGLSVDIDRFTELSKRYKFKLIEDAAESFGSEYKNRRLGSFDHTTIFSFQIAKQLTTIEGGCISTENKTTLKKLNQIKDYGRNDRERYVHDVIGTNFRTTDIQSAIGIQQLKKVEKSIRRRNDIASEYKNGIKNIDFQTIPKYATRHSYMLFFALANNKIQRDKYLKELINKGIDARKAWTPIHMQPCNPELINEKCPNAKDVFDRSFTLPIYNSMSKDETNMVIEAFQSM